MTSKYLAYAFMYWSLIAMGCVIVFQGLSIAWRHYDELRPSLSIRHAFQCTALRAAYYAWWGLIGSIAVSTWHILELTGGTSLPAYWPRLAEWILWGGMHLYLNFRIEGYVNNAAVVE